MCSFYKLLHGVKRYETWLVDRPYTLYTSVSSPTIAPTNCAPGKGIKILRRHPACPRSYITQYLSGFTRYQRTCQPRCDFLRRRHWKPNLVFCQIDMGFPAVSILLYACCIASSEGLTWLPSKNLYQEVFLTTGLLTSSRPSAVRGKFCGPNRMLSTIFSLSSDVTPRFIKNLWHLQLLHLRFLHHARVVQGCHRRHQGLCLY